LCGLNLENIDHNDSGCAFDTWKVKGTAGGPAFWVKSAVHSAS